MLIQLLIHLALSQTLEAATTATTQTCAGDGYSAEMRLSDYPPATGGNNLRNAINAKLQSAQRGKLGLKLDGECCSGGVAWEVPLEGWRAVPHKGAVVYDVTITKMICN